MSAEERAQLLTQKGATVWFTGLSASGKVRIQSRACVGFEFALIALRTWV